MRHFDCNEWQFFAAGPRGDDRSDLRIGLKHHDEIDIFVEQPFYIFQRNIRVVLAIQDHKIDSRPLSAFYEPAADSAVKGGFAGLRQVTDFVPSSRRKSASQPIFPASVFHHHAVRLQSGRQPEDGWPAQVRNLSEFEQRQASLVLKNPQKATSARH
jgi:hypothetical protein